MADRPPPYETHISVDSEVRGLSSKLEIVDNELLILDLERHQARLRQIELKALQRRIKKNRDILRLQNRPNTNYWTSRDHPWDREVKVLLQDKFNLEAFRPKQIEAINALLSGKNVITICPPGYGKSLIYQLPACMVQDKITIVIEPTVSKIADQILKLRQFNIKSTTLNSFSRATEPKKIHERINLNKSRISFLFVTAQWVARSALFRRHIRKYFLRGDLARIVIDEFQYCSRSCPEYKISYGNLNALKNISPRIPILALSSGAKNEALEDFQKLLNLQEAVIISEVTNNTNIYLKVVSKPIKLKQSVRFLKHMLLNDLEGKFGIIYVTSTTLAFKVKRLLDIDHLNIVVYTQSLNFKERNKIHNKWFNGEIQIIITATEALFDIEKPDVDFVLHFCAPKSMDVFYYEVSKAGRNRQKAEAILFYNIYDIFNNVCKIGEDKNITKALDILNYAQNLLVSLCDKRHDERSSSDLLSYCVARWREARPRPIRFPIFGFTLNGLYKSLLNR
ncbi:unnamed protein product [Brassicogethes aeneus]|uniref:DNA 3'-5' helicase n=1 Tax=Brassicogethes aeneus TaxID=1431903 RepID=A0A9P0FNR0_BRAAE|nr:unnamed protein product [Brassicogethes aeneus]